MAKAKKNSFREGPWKLAKGQIDSFIKVTNLARKNAVVQGRILYHIEQVGKEYTFNGVTLITPCFSKGYYWYPYMPWIHVPSGVPSRTHWRVYIDDTDREQWIATFKHLIDTGIEKGNLYINPKDPILKFYKE